MFPTSTTKISNFYLATNPVNIYIDSRHICLFSYSYFSKFKKNVIHDSTENSNEYGSSIAKVMLSNAHLTAGLNKNFYSSLSLCHVPDLLILADKNCHKEFESDVYNHTSFLNLPSFSENDFKFKVYYTYPNKTEDS